MNKYSHLQIEALIDLEETERLYDLFNRLTQIQIEIEACKRKVADLTVHASQFSFRL